MVALVCSRGHRAASPSAKIPVRCAICAFYAGLPANAIARVLPRTKHTQRGASAARRHFERVGIRRRGAGSGGDCASWTLVQGLRPVHLQPQKAARCVRSVPCQPGSSVRAHSRRGYRVPVTLELCGVVPSLAAAETGRCVADEALALLCADTPASGRDALAFSFAPLRAIDLNAL